MSGRLVLDVVTLPDTEAGCRHYSLGELGDDNAAKAMFHLHTQSTTHAELPENLQAIVCLTGLYWHDNDALPEWVEFGATFSASGDIEGCNREATLLAELHQFMLDKQPELTGWNSSVIQGLLQTRWLKYLNILTLDQGRTVEPLGFNTDLADCFSMPNKALPSDTSSDSGLFELASLLSVPVVKSLSLRDRWDYMSVAGLEALQQYAYYKAYLTGYISVAALGMTGEITVSSLKQQTLHIEEKLQSLDLNR